MDEVDVRWLMTPEAPGADELLAEILNRPVWHRRAACRGMGTDLFFPERGSTGSAKALAVCERCPVRSPGREVAIEDPRTPGVWGGTTGRARRQMRKGAA